MYLEIIQELGEPISPKRMELAVKINIKSKYIIEGNDSYAIGNRNSIASGSDNNFILGNGVSIGKNITKSVVLGDGSTAEESNVVSVGSSSQQRKIVHVADGTAEHDAVNKNN